MLIVSGSQNSKSEITDGKIIALSIFWTLLSHRCFEQTQVQVYPIYDCVASSVYG